MNRHNLKLLLQHMTEEVEDRDWSIFAMAWSIVGWCASFDTNQILCLVKGDNPATTWYCIASGKIAKRAPVAQLD